MNGSLSGAWERMGRGSCVHTIGIRHREHVSDAGSEKFFNTAAIKGVVLQPEEEDVLMRQGMK
ncbi:hypothetical protein PAMP_007444 [Pampus punctatissimus]